MKPEPLKGKERHQNEVYDDEMQFSKDYFIKKDIRSAVEWYLKYKDNEYAFHDDCPKLWRIWMSKVRREKFSTWLLKIAFEDVVKRVKKL